jgi:hypothetical protein
VNNIVPRVTSHTIYFFEEFFTVGFGSSLSESQSSKEQHIIALQVDVTAQTIMGLAKPPFFLGRLFLGQNDFDSVSNKMCHLFQPSTSHFFANCVTLW